MCEECGLGLVLECRLDAAPDPDDAFLVVDSSLRVGAVSREAEAILQVREDGAVDRPLSELLAAADVEGVDALQLPAAIIDASYGVQKVNTVYVRPWNIFGVRVRARVVPCGPPRAALIVLEGLRSL